MTKQNKVEAIKEILTKTADYVKEVITEAVVKVINREVEKKKQSSPKPSETEAKKDCAS